MRPAFDPWSPLFVAHPYDVYAYLRENEPVSWFEPTGQWLISRHADVDALLRDRRLGRTYLHVATHSEMCRPDDPAHLAPFWHVIRNGILDMEPPDHTRLRRLVSQAFTPRRVEALRPTVQRIADRLVDEFVADGGGDLIARVAEPLPVTVIAEMLGVPEADRHLLRPWSADICGMYELNPSREVADRAVRACEEFSDYLRGLAAARRGDPRDDLITALTQVDGLTEDELVGTCVLLLNAGHEATVNTTGNGWWALFRNPGELTRLRASADLLPTAIEELMRYDTPAQMFERWVLEDITISGVDIPRGSEVALLFGSANHDPAVFTDPARLNLGRAENPHISFGAGIHYCLGAPLARIELTASFGALLAKAPAMKLVETPKWKPGYIIRGLETLLVEV
ncbi:cytochrome P450 [Planosporangium flavigriseum]|uniref:cytochrome P450 n=1 Tax=Planosporangium flavigriseum TaxID=373681 RepID=UPI00194F22C0|nr:cytochrome P450 [Planosporangium flavigriseum]